MPAFAETFRAEPVPEPRVGQDARLYAAEIKAYASRQAAKLQGVERWYGGVRRSIGGDRQ